MYNQRVCDEVLHLLPLHYVLSYNLQLKVFLFEVLVLMTD